MSRIDKYEPLSGGFRAPLNAAFTGGTNGVDFGKVYAVSLNASGKVVLGTAGGTGLAGVIIVNEAKAANEIVDVMQDGEIVEFKLQDGNAATPGTVYGAAADGSFGAGGTARIGFTVEATRLVVRVAVGSVPA